MPYLNSLHKKIGKPVKNKLILRSLLYGLLSGTILASESNTNSAITTTSYTSNQIYSSQSISPQQNSLSISIPTQPYNSAPSPLSQSPRKEKTLKFPEKT